MDDDNKLPLKRVEFSLTKFNDVAIPHHLDLLRQHKANIIKYEEQGEYVRARAEQTHARRVAAQLRGLLLELETLRRQVRDIDRARFDALTQRSRDTTLRAIVDYLGLIEDSCRALVSSAGRSRLTGTSPLSINRSVSEVPVAASAVSTDSVGVVAHAPCDGDCESDAGAPAEFASQIQLQVDDHAVGLQEREALLRGWSELQAELRALHDVWQSAQAAALAQRDQVTAAAGSVEVAAENVSVARGHLAAAERLRAGAWGAGGAALGLLAGGPVGLAVIETSRRPRKGAWRTGSEHRPSPADAQQLRAGAWGAGGAALGLLAGGPVGLAVGAKAGALAAAAGSLLGYVGARVLGHRRGMLEPPPDTDTKDGKND